MAGSFPLPLQYPLRYTVSCATEIMRGQNSAIQAWAKRPAMVEIDLSMRNLTSAQQATLQGFHDSQKGAYDSTWTLTLDLGLSGTDMDAYTGMRFLTDELRWEETLPGRWSTRLRVRGWYPTGWTYNGSLAFPSTLAGFRAGNKRRQYETQMIDMESGARHALAYRGGGLTNFPEYPLLQWEPSWPQMTPAQAAELIQFHVNYNGRFGTFSYTDIQDSQTFTGCRLGSDTLEVQYLGYGRCSSSCLIEKY